MKKITENQEISGMRKSERPSLFAAILALCCCLSSILLAAEENGWSMEFRIAADPTKDTLIVNKAKSSPENELYEDKSLIAKWVPVIESKTSDFLKHSSFVTRRNTQGQVELFVLVSENDVTESDVCEIGTTLDMNGKLALSVRFKDVDTPKLLELTKNNLGRQVAQIINGQVYNAPYIRSTLHTQAIITGDFTEDTFNKMLKDSPFRLRPSYPSPPPYAITVTPLRIIIFLIILLFLIFASLPTRGLKQSKHPRSWIVVGIVIGIVIGGYWLGVTKTTTGPDFQNGIPPWGQLIRINILGILSGSVIGAVLGVAGGYLFRFIVRRAIHNVFCFSRRATEALLPSKAAVVVKVVQRRKRKHLNKKQLVVVWLSILVIALFVIFPPWIGSRTKIITDESPEGYAGEDYEFIGFHFLFSGEDLSWDTLCIITKIHYNLLALLCGCTAVLSGVFMFLLRTRTVNPKYNKQCQPMSEAEDKA